MAPGGARTRCGAMRLRVRVTAVPRRPRFECMAAILCPESPYFFLAAAAEQTFVGLQAITGGV